MLKSHCRILDNNLYPKRAVADARTAYRDYCDVRVTQDNAFLTLTIQVKSKYQKDGHQIILEFWNYLLDISCQMKISD